MMNKEQLQKALTTLSETIDFCRFELQEYPGSDGLRDNINDLVQLREQLRHLHEAASDTSVLCLIGQNDPFEHLNQMYQAANEASDKERG